MKELLNCIISPCLSWLCKEVWTVKPNQTKDLFSPISWLPKPNSRWVRKNKEAQCKHVMVPPWNSWSIQDICRVGTFWFRTIICLLSSFCYIFHLGICLNHYQTCVNFLHWQTSSAKSYTTVCCIKMEKHGEVWVRLHWKVTSHLTAEQILGCPQSTKILFLNSRLFGCNF